MKMLVLIVSLEIIKIVEYAVTRPWIHTGLNIHISANSWLKKKEKALRRKAVFGR